MSTKKTADHLPDDQSRAENTKFGITCDELVKLAELYKIRKYNEEFLYLEELGGS